MYAGEVVEESPVREIFAAAHHPYTEGLLRAMPRVGATGGRLAVIPGSVPPPTEWPDGCRFRDRCPYAWERCEREHPPLYQIGAGHTSRCHLAVEPERRAHPHTPLAAATGAGAGR
jgi:oligopeptide/dipeptide ABC transporter ATP-binding protein